MVDMTVQASPYTVVVSLASLSLPQYAGITGGAWTQVLKVTAVAAFTSPSTTPDNNAEVTVLAQQIATDWYLWQLGREDLVLTGICPWQPDGYNDTILWKYHPDQLSTRIQRGPFSDFTDQLYYHGSEGDQVPDCGCPGSGGGGGGSSNPPIVTPPVTDPTGGGGGTVPIPPGTGKILFSPAGSETITALSGAVAGQQLVVWNSGSGVVKLAHNTGGANGIITPLGVDYWVQPGSGVTLEYGGPTLKWRFDNPTFGAGSTPEYECRLLLPGNGVTITPNGDGSATIAAPNQVTGAGGDIHAWHDTQKWYAWFLASIVTTPSSPVGNVVTIPFLATTPFAADQIGIGIVNNDAVSHNARLAIYKNTSANNLYPKELLFDSGNLTVTPSGVFQDITANINLTLLGLYWLALQVDDVNLIARYVAWDGTIGNYPLLGRDGPSGGGWLAWLKAQAYGAFSDPFPGGASRVNGGPWIHLHHAV
jgi:hypothetical protein